MNLDQLMTFARNFNRLGWAVQEQVEDMVDGDYDDLNPNALQEINNSLRGYNDDLDACIDEALESNKAKV